jgi:SAM-dependent methyltransferase
VTCLVCQSADIRYLYAQAGHRVWRCRACGFTFVHPTPSAGELARFYAQSYAVPFERYAANEARNLGRIADLERWQPGRGRLLEVGASYGHSLALARARGWQVAGVELSPSASAYARERLRLDVACCDLLDAPLAAGSFDAAIMWHVLEHTRDPRAQLRRLFELLRPGGVLGVRVPNIASLGARLAGRSWPWMSPPGHLWYFSPATLPALLRACGFEPLEVATLRGDGNNPYQHALIGLGGRLNGLRRRVRGRLATPVPAAPTAPAPAALGHDNPPALLDAWNRLLARAQPITDALARATSPIVGPIERGGGGDELLCYARRIV